MNDYSQNLKDEITNLIDKYCLLKFTETHPDKVDDLESIIYNLECCEDLIGDLVSDEKYE